MRATFAVYRFDHRKTQGARETRAYSDPLDETRPESVSCGKGRQHMRKANAGNIPATRASGFGDGYESIEERRAAGKALRDATPRAAHGGWKAPHKRRDPIDLLRESQQRAHPAADPCPFRANGAIALRLLSGLGRPDGRRSGFDPGNRGPRAGLRRRSPHEFWRFRYSESATFSSTSMISTKLCRRHGNGTSSAWQPAWLSPHDISACPKARPPGRRRIACVPTENE